MSERIERKKSPARLDELDKKILEELWKDSRQSCNRISQKLKVVPSTVHKRIEKLKDIGVIERFTIDIDYEKLGYGLLAISFGTGDYSAYSRLGEKLCKIPSTMAVYLISGEYDFVSVLKLKNSRDLYKYISSLSQIKEVHRTNTNVVVEKVIPDTLNLI